MPSSPPPMVFEVTKTIAAYTTDGIARRGPVTFRVRDVERLRAALREHPGLADALGFGGDA